MIVKCDASDSQVQEGRMTGQIEEFDVSEVIRRSEIQGCQV